MTHGPSLGVSGHPVALTAGPGPLEAGVAEAHIESMYMACQSRTII